MKNNTKLDQLRNDSAKSKLTSLANGVLLQMESPTEVFKLDENAKLKLAGFIGAKNKGGDLQIETNNLACHYEEFEGTLENFIDNTIKTSGLSDGDLEKGQKLLLNEIGYIMPLSDVLNNSSEYSQKLEKATETSFVAKTGKSSMTPEERAKSILDGRNNQGQREK